LHAPLDFVLFVLSFSLFVLRSLSQLIEAHPALISIEDAFEEKDYPMWQKFTARFSDRIMIVGDDLFTTNTNLIRQGLAGSWANSLLLKVNQIGTISEAMSAARMFFGASLSCFVFLIPPDLILSIMCFSCSRLKLQTPIAKSSSRIARAKLSLRSFPIWWWPLAPSSSRPALLHAASAWPSTTGCCRSKKSCRLPGCLRKRDVEVM
jgi:enolase